MTSNCTCPHRWTYHMRASVAQGVRAYRRCGDCYRSETITPEEWQDRVGRIAAGRIRSESDQASNG